MEEVVEQIAAAALGTEGWSVHRPEGGWSTTTYVAARPGLRVVVKLESGGEVWRRAAAIGAGPSVIADGHLDGLSYVILEFVEGAHLGSDQLAARLDDAVAILTSVHQDLGLREFLRPAGRTVPHQIEALEGSYERVRLSFQDERRRKNFILRGSRLVLIDWEGAALADPLRDLGPLLWWYAPPSRWEALLHRYGADLTPELAGRIYWWAACYSLDIAAGLLERGYHEEARGYLEDLLAAAASLTPLGPPGTMK